MNYFELYPGDYKRDTSRLSLTEHGAYLQLMLAYYGEEQALPADYPDLYRIACAITPEDQVAVRRVADKFFPVAADGLRHKNRIDEEIAKARKRMETARENGRKHKPKVNPTGNPVGSSRDNPEGTQRDSRSGEALQTPDPSRIPEDSIHTGLSAAVSDSVGVFEGHEFPRDTPNPTAAFAVALNHAGFSVTSLNPELVAYVQAGGTVAHLLECAAKPECRGRKAGYPISIARRELAEPAVAVATGPPRPGQGGKTMQALESLEAMKNGLAQAGNSDGVSKAGLPQLGQDAGC